MINELKEKFKCFEDPNFKFDPKWHKYTYNGKQYTSVTKFISKFHKEFDQEYWSKKKSEELDIDQEVLLKKWKDKNDYANLVGHTTHDWIEGFYKKEFRDLPINIDIVERINKFNRIYATHLFKLEPVKFEVRIFSKKYPIAGTIDSIFIYKGKLFCLDWKTNGNFTTDETKKYNKLLHPFEDYYENHLNEYSIQVGLYALILKEWGFDIRGGYLVHIGPDGDAKIHSCVDMMSILEKYLESYVWN